MKNLKISMLTVLSVLLLSTAANAAKKGAYLGVGYDFAQSFATNSSSQNSDAQGEYLNGFSVVTGYNFAVGSAFSYGLELKYNIGVNSDTESFLTHNEITKTLNNEIGGAVNLFYNLNPNTSFLAQIGGGWMGSTTTFYDDRTEPLKLSPLNGFGFMSTNVGVEHTLYKGLSLRTMFETKYLMSNKDMPKGVSIYDLGASVNLVYNF